MTVRKFYANYLILVVPAICLCSCSDDSVAPVVDLTPPERVAELSASPDGLGIEVSWMAPPEQNLETFIDYATFSPSTEEEWQQATRYEVTGIDRFDHSARINDLEPSTTYYFSVLTRDYAGNISERSPTVFAHTGPRFLRTIATEPSTGGIAVAPTGDVYLSKGSDLLWLPSGFPEVVTIATEWSVIDVAVDLQGRVFTLSRHAPYLARLTFDGVREVSWGEWGSSAGEFDTAEAISIDSAGRVLVADRMNRRVQLFDSDGVWMTTWSMMDSGGARYEPYEMAVGPDDDLYVLAKSVLYGDALLKFDNTGEFVARWGSIHDGAMDDDVIELATAIGVGTFGGQEMVFVSARIGVKGIGVTGYAAAFSSEGQLITKWPTRVAAQGYQGQLANAIAATESGGLLLSGFAGGGIDVYEVVP